MYIYTANGGIGFGARAAFPLGFMVFPHVYAMVASLQEQSTTFYLYTMYVYCTIWVMELVIKRNKKKVPTCPIDLHNLLTRCGRTKHARLVFPSRLLVAPGLSWSTTVHNYIYTQGEPRQLVCTMWSILDYRGTAVRGSRVFFFVFFVFFFFPSSHPLVFSICLRST